MVCEKCTSRVIFSLTYDDNIASASEQTAPKSRSARAPWNLFVCARRAQRSKYRIPVQIRRCEKPLYSIDEVNDHARGYPNLAAFLDSDRGFTIFRRFGYLQSRLLLDKQEELRLLEEKLSKLDKTLAREDEFGLCTRDSEGPNAEKHKKLISIIGDKFCSYGRSNIHVLQFETYWGSRGYERRTEHDGPQASQQLRI